MQAMFEMTEGQRRLGEIIKSFPPDSSHWNEAQNRFQFVDRLLIECLGWERPDISVEDRDEANGIADYILGHPIKAVLEAKREALQWNALPSGNSSRVRKIEPLLRACKEFNAVVNQIVPYCSLRGAQIGIVCNGPQLAIFQAITIGQEPLKGECYLFNGFQSLIDDFPLLWSLLSPEGVTENRALRDLARHRNPRIPSKASQSIPEPNKHRYRDDLQNELRELGSFLLEEIEDNPEMRTEFYRNCYVPLEANSRNLLLSKQIIGSRYSRVGTDGQTPSALDSVSKTGSIGDQFFVNAGSKPIVVIGDVGVGKSSFFENLYINFDKPSGKKTFFITIDLGKSANLTDGIKNYVLETIPEVLFSNYNIDINDADFVRSIYNDELRRFDNSISGESKSTDIKAYELDVRKFLLEKTQRRDAHLHRSLGHIAKGRKERIVLIIDNADQRNFDIQQDAFLIAQEFAAKRSVFVFVALRPSTFYLSKMTGALSAYQNKILTISPPPADKVIQKRLTFALRVAEGKAAPNALDGIKLKLGSLVLFLTATLRSVKSNENIRQFLSNITGGNTKAVIELITSFCGSPNVDARKIVEIEERSGNYLVPIHEFTKHALLGEFSYYSPQSSLVACNIFDISMADQREHFLAPLIVGYLGSNVGSKDKDGFVSGEKIAEEMISQGFIEDQVESCLRNLASRKLIETPHSHFRELKVLSDERALMLHFRATSVGAYHIRYWCGSFSFLDAMSTDTPIFDEAIRNRVTERAGSFDIMQRFEKTASFRDYLESSWHQGNFQNTYFDFPNVIKLQARDFEIVERAAIRPRHHYKRD